MESSNIKDRRNSQRVPVELSIVGELDGQRIAMCSANISRDGMFLYSREFVRPHAVFCAWVWLESDEEPLKVYLTSCFIESTRAGFALGVQISGMASDDAKRWQTFYRGCVQAQLEQPRPAAKPEAGVGNRHILVVGTSLHELAIQALRSEGLQVSCAPSTVEAFAVLRRERIDAVISDMRAEGSDGAALCSYVKIHRLATRVVLLSCSAQAREYLVGMYAGATRVISKPCGNNLLVGRIVEALRQPVPPAGSGTSSELPGRVSDEAIATLSAVTTPMRVAASRAAYRRVTQRVSKSVREAVRFVTDRLAARLPHYSRDLAAARDSA